MTPKDVHEGVLNPRKLSIGNCVIPFISRRHHLEDDLDLQLHDVDADGAWLDDAFSVGAEPSDRKGVALVPSSSLTTFPVRSAKDGECVYRDLEVLVRGGGDLLPEVVEERRVVDYEPDGCCRWDEASLKLQAQGHVVDVDQPVGAPSSSIRSPVWYEPKVEQVLQPCIEGCNP